MMRSEKKQHMISQAHKGRLKGGGSKGVREKYVRVDVGSLIYLLDDRTGGEGLLGHAVP